MRDGTQVTEIFVRVDVRNLNCKFLGIVLRLAAKCDCALLTEDMRLIEPDEGLLLDEIERSPAAQFVEDPARFLERRNRLRK